MPSLYARWMYDWETRLTSVDNNRVIRPLEWGIEWTREWPCRNGFLSHQTPNDGECERYLLEYNARAITASDEFFTRFMYWLASGGIAPPLGRDRCLELLDPDRRGLELGCA